MEKFIIEGGARLSGEVVASGNKNAALPLLASCLLTDEPLILHNVPRIRDVHTMIRLLETLGVSVTWLDTNSVRLHAKDVRAQQLDPQLCREIRASILLAGPMLARQGAIELPPWRRCDWAAASRHALPRPRCARRHNQRQWTLLAASAAPCRSGHHAGRGERHRD